MTYLATALSLTLGAWRIRLRIDVEDAPQEVPAPVTLRQNYSGSPPSRSATRHP